MAESKDDYLEGFHDEEENISKKIGNGEGARRLSLSEGNFYINRMDQLNEKIGCLSVCLDDFHPSNIDSQLVIDKNIHNDPFYKNNSAVDEVELDDISGFGYIKEEKTNDLTKKKSKQAQNSKELDQFAGMYSLKTVLTPSLQNVSQQSSPQSFRKRMQSKIGMSESLQNLSKKPMLVELHTFPGYDSDDITPLPPPFTSLDIQKIVTSAQLDLERKPTFKKDFTKFFYSRLSQAILCDTFWWYFCEKHQKMPESQEKLFNRIAHNYTKLLIRWIGSKYQDTIFKRYPDLLAQSVYTTFCQSFPTSYRQFGDKFKDDLIFLVYQWITGTKPAPRIFEKWNFPGLEPNDMRKGEKLHMDVAKKSKKSDLEMDLNEMSLSLLKPTESKQKTGPSSMASSQARTRKVSRAVQIQTTKRGNLQLPSIHKPVLKDDSPLLSENQKNYQLDSQKPSGTKILIETVESKEAKDITTHQLEPASTRLMPKMKSKRESCKAGKGPGFSKNVFDIYGRSPLIEQFLISNHLSQETGIGMLVRRTEIASLPSPSAPTYDDIIKESLRMTKRVEKKYRSSLEESAAERAKILKNQREVQRRLSRRTAELMASPNEVKRISNMLRLHLLRDQNDDYDSLSADIKSELSKALGYEVVEQSDR